jgi:hypothetical protein
LNRSPDPHRRRATLRCTSRGGRKARHTRRRMGPKVCRPGENPFHDRSAHFSRLHPDRGGTVGDHGDAERARGRQAARQAGPPLSARPWAGRRNLGARSWLGAVEGPDHPRRIPAHRSRENRGSPARDRRSPRRPRARRMRQSAKAAGTGVDRRAKGVLSVGHLLTDLGVLPALLPFLIAERGLSLALAGTLVLAATVSSSAMQVVFGILSDRRSMPALMPLGVLLLPTGSGAAPWSQPPWPSCRPRSWVSRSRARTPAWPCSCSREKPLAGRSV